MQVTTTTKTNNLFPVFLKLEEMHVLLVGAGKVGLEKLQAIVSNAPATSITVVAGQIADPVKLYAALQGNILLIEKQFEPADLQDKDIVIVAVNNPSVGEYIRVLAHENNLLVNVADTPALCDFYLGSIVQKGNLKIAISTNGNSPTIAKRIKEVLNDALPADLDSVLLNMRTIRQRMNGNFESKVKKLNAMTRVLVEKEEVQKARWWKQAAIRAGIAILLMIAGFIIFSNLLPANYLERLTVFYGTLHIHFFWMLLTGFLAQLIAGSMGMGYGVICTTVLLSIGISPPAISSSIHTAESLTSGVTAYSHFRFKNVNKKMAGMLIIPGIIGAIIGAILLSMYGDHYAEYIRPLLAAYTLILGLKILMNAFKKNKVKPAKPNIPLLATIGGFIDSFGGGGWGPLMTGTIIRSGRTPKYAIGSVCVGKFFVTIASAVTFFITIGISHWQIIAGLLLGGIVAAPFSASLASKIPARPMFIAVGVVIILCSLKILSRLL